MAVSMLAAEEPHMPDGPRSMLAGVDLLALQCGLCEIAGQQINAGGRRPGVIVKAQHKQWLGDSGETALGLHGGGIEEVSRQAGPAAPLKGDAAGQILADAELPTRHIAQGA
ncbi:hypothetical protein KP05_14770 [Cobetia amphilecti]|nr:hypothetical protein KP05_14770 [Cobetia amphilecti]